MDFRKQWDTWAWLIPFALIALAFTRVLFGREPFCAGAQDEHCLREWISALGSWAAVPAAVITVVFLSKQIQDAAKHHRQTVAVQLDQKYEMVKAMQVVLGWALRDVQAWIDSVKSPEGQLQAEIDFARRLHHIYGQPIFDEFTSAFFIEVPVSLDAIRAALKEKVDAADGPSTLRNIVMRTKALQLDVVQDFNRACISTVQRFLDRYDGLTAA